MDLTTANGFFASLTAEHLTVWLEVVAVACQVIAEESQPVTSSVVLVSEHWHKQPTISPR
jgi:hypothetical protein